MRRYWNESAGQEWVGLEDEFERALAPVGTEMLRRAGARAGERVLDVGCGLGGTTLAVARAVGAEGRVMGLDISAPMLVRARQRAADAGLANIDWRDGDAQDAVLPVRYFDLIVSRFGVMFFDDPAAAFENLCGAAKSGGRLSFACWQSPSTNAWFTLAARTLAPFLEVPPPSDGPGPFALADPERVLHLLEAAGFVDVEIDDFRLTMVQGGHRGIDGAVDQMLRGPVAAALRAAPPKTRQAGLDALRAAISLHVEDGEVRFPAATWMVSARAPGEGH